MASKVVLMTALFDQFTAFISELAEMYPEDPDFSMFLTSVRLAKSANPNIVVKYMYEHTSAYETQIMNKDETFFLTSSFEEHKENVDMDIFSKMKVYFSSMSADSKESVWKYSQNILRLAKACYSFANSS
jgi:hypothetical protein